LQSFADPKRIVSWKPISSTPYFAVQYDDGSTEYQDGANRTVGSAEVQAALDKRGGPVIRVTSSSSKPGAGANATVQASLPWHQPYYRHMGVDASIAQHDEQAKADASTPPDSAPVVNSGGMPRFHGISFAPQLRTMTPLAQASVPQVVEEHNYGPNGKVVAYSDTSRKVYTNDHKYVASGKQVPSVDPNKHAYQYKPAPGFQNVDNPLWGRADLHRDAVQFKGVRELTYDQATGLTRVLFNDPHGGTRFYNGALKLSSAPERGAVSDFDAAVQGTRQSFGEAGADIERGRPILGHKVKDVVVGTAKTIGGVMENSGGYVYDRLQHGKGHIEQRHG